MDFSYKYFTTQAVPYALKSVLQTREDPLLLCKAILLTLNYTRGPKKPYPS
jgi:hypothetical protein